jgi:hypothetical protein
MLRQMSVVAVILLVAAVVLLVATEWSAIYRRFGVSARTSRDRARRKKQLRVVSDESDDFARSVERDLASLPTIDEHPPKRR